MALLCHPHRLEGNLNALAFLPLHCNTRILLDPTHCPWYPLYPLLGFYLTGTIASDPETAKQCLYNMDRESHILLTTANQHQFDALLPFTHQLILDDLSLWDPYGAQVTAQGIPCILNLAPDQPYTPLPQGITGLRLQLTDPTDLDELESALAVFETNWADALPHLTRLHLGGPFPLLRPEFDLVRLTDLIQTFRTHHPLTLELTVGETLFGGALTPLPYDPGMEFPPDKPHLYTGTPDAPVPFLHF